MARKEYISVDADTRKTEQEVNLTNVSNRFTGEFFLRPDSEGEEPIDIREKFGDKNVIEKITVNHGRPLDIENKTVNIEIAGPDGGQDNTIETIKVNGTALVPDDEKAVDIPVPSPGDTNVIETIQINGNPLEPNNKTVNIQIKVNGTPAEVDDEDKSIDIPTSKLIKVEFSEEEWNGIAEDPHASILESASTSKPGDLVVVKHDFTEGEDTHTAIATYVVVMVADDDGQKKELLPLAPSRLKGGLNGEILSTVNDAGESELRIDEIEFDELWVNNLYIDGLDIKNLLPNIQVLKDLETIPDKDTDPPYDLSEVVAKLNNVIEVLKAAGSSQKDVLPKPPATESEGEEDENAG